MPFKDPKVHKAKHKEYSAKYYEKNKEAEKDRINDRRRKKRREWKEYKASLSCSSCGFSHPACIDFHHPPGTKEYSVNDLAQNGRFKLAYAEAAKCIVLCSNCHRIHHYNERQKEKGHKPPSIPQLGTSLPN
jgi:ribosomal protein L32E